MIQYFLKEMQSLRECLAHWSYLLKGRCQTIVYVDSRYLSYWVSLQLISEKVARWVSLISEYDIAIHFLPSTCNMSDQFTRLSGEPEGMLPDARNIFKGIKIYNSEGERLTNEQLFSSDKRIEMNKYFEENKRGPIMKVYKGSEMLAETNKIDGPDIKAKGVGSISRLWQMARSRTVGASDICTYRGTGQGSAPISRQPRSFDSQIVGGPDEIRRESGIRGTVGGQFRRETPTSVPAGVGGEQNYKDAYGQRRVSQKDIQTDIGGQHRTDGQTNIELTYRTMDNIRVVKRRKGRGKRNENRWRRKTENKLNVAKESGVSCRCDGLGGKNQT